MSSPGSLSNRGGYVGVIWSFSLSWFAKEARLVQLCWFLFPVHPSSWTITAPGIWIRWLISDAFDDQLEVPEVMGFLQFCGTKHLGRWLSWGKDCGADLRVFMWQDSVLRNAQTGWRNSHKCPCSARRREPGFVSLLSPALHCYCSPIRVALAQLLPTLLLLCDHGNSEAWNTRLVWGGSLWFSALTLNRPAFVSWDAAA